MYQDTTTKGNEMTNYYRADAVKIENSYFESLETAIAYITNNYAEWCLVNFMDTTLVSVEYDDGAVWVEYTLDDEDFADDNKRREPFYVNGFDLITAV